MRKYLCCFLLVLSGFPPAGAQDRERMIADGADSIVTAAMAGRHMVGLSIGIVRNGQVVLEKGYGTADIRTGRPVDSLSSFLTCSITKVFTATAVMQLVEQGRLELDRKLVDYLPDFSMKDERYKDITILHLLTHTSGLTWDTELDGTSPNDTGALRMLLYSLRNKRLTMAPGGTFDATKTYSNAGFDMLGYLVQSVSGMPYGEYIRTQVLVKAGMHRSGLDYRQIAPDRLAAPHILKRGKPVPGGMWAENTEHAPSANLHSCAADLCSWMIHLLRIYGGQDTTGGVLRQKTLREMWTTSHTAPQNSKVSIGLSWFITESATLGTYYWHVGRNPGYSSTLMLFPKYDMGIVVLCNEMYNEQIIWNKIPIALAGIMTAAER